MLAALNDRLERGLSGLLALAFAGLIGTVFLQVLARNVLEQPLIWTLDVAQLLFSWCIFLGAAVAFRRGGHYALDLWPRRWGGFRLAVAVLAWLASAVVILVLLRYGIVLTEMANRRQSASMGISELWFFLPIPLGAGAMALFLVEQALGAIKGWREAAS